MGPVLQRLSIVASLCGLGLLASCAEPMGIESEEGIGDASYAVSSNGSVYVDSANRLRNVNDHRLRLRGVNLPYAWYKSQSLTDLWDGTKSAIAQRGANTVRITLDRNVTSSELTTLLDKVKSAGLYAILYLTDFTGGTADSDINGTSGAVAWWSSTGNYSGNGIKSVITNANYKPQVIINLANEWMGSWNNGSQWYNSYKTAINTLRTNGVNHTLVIDAAGYGQESASIKGYAAQLRRDVTGGATGNGRDVVFSLHMYDVFHNSTLVKQGFDACKQTGVYVSGDGNGVANVPCMIGEFGPVHYRTTTCPNGQAGPSQCPVDEDTILSVARAQDVPFMGWSWYGNTPVELAQGLDMLTNFSASGGTPTTWGNRVFYGTDAIGTIEAEDFIASVDSDTTFNGSTACQNNYNNYTDTAAESAQSGGCVLGWIAANEQWDYKVGIFTAGNQTIKVRYSAPAAGSSIQVYVVNAAGTQYLKGTISLAATGAYTTYAWSSAITISEPSNLIQKIRLKAVTGGFNLDAIEFN
jgi:mannan endo-1,4-beta-mannosidase